jgi:hypothetical protein
MSTPCWIVTGVASLVASVGRPTAAARGAGASGGRACVCARFFSQMNWVS